MRKYWLPFVLAFLLLGSSGLYADVILSDTEAAELEATLDELETISLRQKQRISDLQMRNEELENQLNQLETQSNDRTNLLEKQETTINEAKNLYKKQSIFSILRNILIAVISCGVGIVIGLFI